MEELIKKAVMSVLANTGTRIVKIEVMWTGFIQVDPEIDCSPRIASISMETCKEYNTDK